MPSANRPEPQPSPGSIGFQQFGQRPSSCACPIRRRFSASSIGRQSTERKPSGQGARRPRFLGLLAVSGHGVRAGHSVRPLCLDSGCRPGTPSRWLGAFLWICCPLAKADRDPLAKAGLRHSGPVFGRYGARPVTLAATLASSPAERIEPRGRCGSQAASRARSSVTCSSSRTIALTAAGEMPNCRLGNCRWPGPCAASGAASVWRAAGAGGARRGPALGSSNTQ